MIIVIILIIIITIIITAISYCYLLRSIGFKSPMYKNYKTSVGIVQPVTQVKVKQSNYRLWQAQRVPGGWGSHISKHSVHDGGKVVNPRHLPPLPPRKYSWYSFPLEAESTPGPQCGRKDCVNEKKCNDTIGNRTRDLPSPPETGIEASHALMFSYLRKYRQKMYRVTLWRVLILIKQSCSTATCGKATMLRYTCIAYLVGRFSQFAEEA
jgi:hypothetical protein